MQLISKFNKGVRFLLCVIDKARFAHDAAYSDSKDLTKDKF